MAFDSAGNLYVANYGSGFAPDGTILKYTLPGGAVTIFATNLVAPSALAFDPADNLYVADYFDSLVQKITPTGIVTVFASVNMNAPDGLTFDSNTNLYVANFNDGTIYVYDPTGASSASPYFVDGGQVFAIAFDSNTNLYVTDTSSNLLKITSSFVVTTNGTTGSSPVGLAYFNSNTDDPNNLSWQPQSTTFKATLPRTPLVLDAGTGSNIVANSMISTPFTFNATFDAFTLTQLPSDLYYQPEQSLADIPGTSPLGEWQLEVLDNRAGATNNARLVDWRLEFVLAQTNLAPAAFGTFNYSTVGIPKPGTLVAGGGYFGYYTVIVPSGATVATNVLLNATLPVDVWFTTTNPATNSSAGGVELLTAVNGGTSVLNAATTPPIVGGQTYYLLIENTNSAPVTFSVRVDFDSTSPTALLKFSSVKLGSTGKPQLKWQNTSGMHYKVQWTDSITPPVWPTINTPTVTVTNQVSTFIDNGTQTAPLGPQRYYRLLRVP
jgi:hypothetical protein